MTTKPAEAASAEATALAAEAAKAAKGNTQIAQYGAGFLFEDNALVDPASIDAVELVIIQPRAFHEDGMVREYEMTPTQLSGHLTLLNDAVAVGLRPDAPLNPGIDQCRFCDANTTCPAREAAALQAVGSTFQQIEQIKAPLLPQPVGLDTARLAYIRLHAPMLRKWLNDVDKHCEELARVGHEIQGAKLVEASAKRTWFGNEAELADKLAALTGEPLSDIMVPRLINITSAEKLVVEAFKRRVGRSRKKKAAEKAKVAFAYFTLKKSSGNLSLVDEDDPRPAVNRAQDNFAHIAGVIPAPNA